MITLQLDRTGNLIVKWPTTEAAILATGVGYVTRESSLPVADQVKSPGLSLVQSVLTEAQTAATTSGVGESARATASEALRQNYNTAKPLLEIAIHQLKAKYYANLAQLENWGLDTVINSTGITVRKPRTQNEWIAFLQVYTTKEAALLVADQLTIPALATMQTLNTDIQAALTARNSGKNTREIGIQGRNLATQRLLDILQVACAILVVVRYTASSPTICNNGALPLRRDSLLRLWSRRPHHKLQNPKRLFEKSGKLARSPNQTKPTL